MQLSRKKLMATWSSVVSGDGVTWMEMEIFLRGKNFSICTSHAFLGEIVRQKEMLRRM